MGQFLGLAAIGMAWVLSFAACYKVSHRILSKERFIWNWWDFAFLPIPPRSFADLERDFWQIINAFDSPAELAHAPGRAPFGVAGAGAVSPGWGGAVAAVARGLISPAVPHRLRARGLDPAPVSVPRPALDLPGPVDPHAGRRGGRSPDAARRTVADPGDCRLPAVSAGFRRRSGTNSSRCSNTPGTTHTATCDTTCSITSIRSPEKTAQAMSRHHLELDYGGRCNARSRLLAIEAGSFARRGKPRSPVHIPTITGHPSEWPKPGRGGPRNDSFWNSEVSGQTFNMVAVHPTLAGEDGGQCREQPCRHRGPPRCRSRRGCRGNGANMSSSDTGGGDGGPPHISP